MLEIETISCSVCGNSEHEVISTKGRDFIKTSVAICTSCGFLYQNPRWSKEEILKYYETKYDSYYRSNFTVNMMTPEVYDAYPYGFHPVYQRIRGYVNPSKELSIVDVGSGEGTNLLYLGKKFNSKKLKAIEPSIEGKKASSIELVILFIIGFIIGFKFLYPFYDSTVLNDFQHYILSWEGSLFGGIAIGLGIAGQNYYQSEKTKLPEPVEVEKEVKPHEHISSIILLALVFGFLGAKVFAWLEDPVPLSEFLHDPFSGLTIYGGLIAASVACIIYIRKQKLHAFHMLDAVSPALMLAYGIGRLGCHFSGDGDWGIENTAAKHANRVETELEAEANRDYLDIMNLVLNGTMTQKEAEEDRNSLLG